MTKQRIGALTFVVASTTKPLNSSPKLGFTLLEDTPLDDHKRWVLVAPAAQPAPTYYSPKQALPSKNLPSATKQVEAFSSSCIYSDDFWHDYNEMKSRGVKFAEEPHTETYGTVAVFFDLYNNKWDLLELKPSHEQ